METFFEYYSELVNLIDKKALSDCTSPNTDEIESIAAQADITVEDFAGANCNDDASSWLDVIFDIRKQFKNGDRIAI